MSETKVKLKKKREVSNEWVDMEIQQLEMLNYMLESCGLDDDGSPSPSYDTIDKIKIRSKIFEIISEW